MLNGKRPAPRNVMKRTVYSGFVMLMEAIKNTHNILKNCWIDSKPTQNELRSFKDLFFLNGKVYARKPEEWGAVLFFSVFLPIVRFRCVQRCLYSYRSANYNIWTTLCNGDYPVFTHTTMRLYWQIIQLAMFG